MSDQMDLGLSGAGSRRGSKTMTLWSAASRATYLRTLLDCGCRVYLRPWEDGPVFARGKDCGLGHQTLLDAIARGSS